MWSTATSTAPRYAATAFGSCAYLPCRTNPHAFSPSFFDGGVDAQFVVHQHVVFGRVTPYDIRQGLLLVHINQDMTPDRLVDTRTLHFARLKDDVSVGQNHRSSPSAKLLQHIES